MQKEARLANAQALEKKLLGLLEVKPTRLKDLLEVEKELARVRGEIEGLMSQKRFMDNRVDLSTINLTLVQPRGFGRGIFAPLSGLVQRALGAFTASFAALIVVVSALIPWLILLFFAGWGVLKSLRVYLKHKRERKKQNHNA